MQLIKDVVNCWGKEFKFYFQSKMIYLILFVYATMSAGFVLYVSDFYENTVANMAQFFIYQPGILATIIPVLTMRLWADEYKYNTLELILTQPISIAAVVLGKFLAAWSVAGIMILSSGGIWVMVAFMVNLDNRWIAINYLITFLMAGSLCALASLIAVFCYNAIAAFLGALALCLLTVMANFSYWIEKIIPDNVILNDLVKSFDFKWQFENMIMGQVGVGGGVYFVLLIVAALWTSLIAVEYKRK